MVRFGRRSGRRGRDGDGGAVEAAGADDDLVGARVADHHAGDFGIVGQEGLSACEAAGVLVAVEEHHQSAVERVGAVTSSAARWAKIATAIFESAAPRP